MSDKIMELFQALFGKMLEWIVGPFADLEPFNKLIYGDPSSKNIYGVFNEAQFEVVKYGMAIMQSLSVGIILISIILAGMRIASSGVNPSNRTYTFEYFRDLALVAILFFNLSTIFEIIYMVNNMFVTAFSTADEMMKGDIVTQTESFMEQGVLGGLIIGLIMLGLWLWANFYYMMRTLTLMLLTIMSPLAVALYLIPQTRGITGGLLKEYIGTVFVQSIHAFLYWIIMAIVGADFSLGSILLMMVFIPVSESIKSLLGLGGQMNDRLSKTAAMFGGSALMGVAASIKGALSGQSVTQTLRGVAGNVAGKGNKGEGTGDATDGPKGLLSGAGTDIGSTARAERMLKAGEVFSKGGKAVFGAAGAIAGSPMGPMGSIAGSTIGAIGGGVVGGAVGRVGMATAETLGNRIGTGFGAGIKKAKGIKNGESLADEKLANTLADSETTKWTEENKDSLMSDIKSRFPDLDNNGLGQIFDKEVAQKRSEFLDKARSTVGALKANNGKFAKSSALVNSTAENLTKDWAKNNEDSFKQKFDAENPLPANPSEGDILRHNQNREQAWKQAIEDKKGAILGIATASASKLKMGLGKQTPFINKDDYISDVSEQVGSVMGTGGRETLSAVRKATDGVKSESLYSNKAVNTPYLANQLASMKTNTSRDSTISSLMQEQGLSKEEAVQKWNTEIAPKEYANNLKSLNQPSSIGGLPRDIKLDHTILKNSAVRGIASVTGGIATGLTAASGIKEIGKFVSDTKIGQGVQALPLGIKQTWNERDRTQSPLTATVDSISGGLKTAWNVGSSHVAENVVEKQAGFRNAVAFGAGIVGGVRGYKAGATYASGGPNVTKAFGLKGFNPYNNAVNQSQELAEISQIEQMAQTVVGMNGKPEIASGAIRMVTTRSQTVLQVKDKAGQVRTVSRLGSGDSSLKNGQSIYQDLTIQDGQITPTSNVYQEDSGGGKIALNRTINVNPNKLVANRNSPKSPRSIQNVQSYNQLVDSGQYYLREAMNEMSNIQMVVDKNRSYLTGQKEGQTYRISPYGPGDTRLTNDKVVVRSCTTRNQKLVVEPSYDEPDYTNSLQPEDLVAYRPQNKRNISRRNNELNRHRAYVESLR